MALSDIIQRIREDAEQEASRIRGEAEARADDIRTAAQASADQERADDLARAKAEADRDASRIVVTARLAARDEALAARRQLIDDALARTVEQLASMPDAEYARFLGRRIADAVRGGESVAFGSADAGRADLVVAEVARIAPERTIVHEPAAAPFERGALVTGTRTRVDLSLSAIVEERRSDLEAAAAAALFGEEA